jgi:hypothetical protein
MSGRRTSDIVTVVVEQHDAPADVIALVRALARIALSIHAGRNRAKDVDGC